MNLKIMIKISLLFMFVMAFSFFTKAQNFLRYNNELVNQVDTNGFRQGKWLVFDLENKPIHEYWFINDTIRNLST